MYRQLDEEVAQSGNNNNNNMMPSSDMFDHQYNEDHDTIPPHYDHIINNDDDDAAKSESARRRCPKTPALEIECLPATEPILAGLGWVRKAFKRNSNPKHIDRYWVTPKKGKKLRSMAEVTHFLGFLRETRGDEDEAYRILKRVNAEKRRNASKKGSTKVEEEQGETLIALTTEVNTNVSSIEATSVIPV